jgi:hypothetical protein
VVYLELCGSNLRYRQRSTFGVGVVYLVGVISEDASRRIPTVIAMLVDLLIDLAREGYVVWDKTDEICGVGRDRTNAGP